MIIIGIIVLLAELLVGGYIALSVYNNDPTTYWGIILSIAFSIIVLVITANYFFGNLI